MTQIESLAIGDKIHSPRPGNLAHYAVVEFGTFWNGKRDMPCVWVLKLEQDGHAKPAARRRRLTDHDLQLWSAVPDAAAQTATSAP